MLPDPDPLTALDAATDRLITTARALGPADVAAPSLLPGWTRGHVLTHLARNADGLARLASSTAAGAPVPMYAGGDEGRAAEIEAGARRTPRELVEDVEASASALRAVVVDLAGSEVVLALRSGTTFRAAQLPGARLREVELHHVDLDAGYTPAHWDQGFATRTLDQVAAYMREHRDSPVAELHAPDLSRTWRLVGADDAGGGRLSGEVTALAAWLTGRAGGKGLAWTGDGPLPAAPTWT